MLKLKMNIRLKVLAIVVMLVGIILPSIVGSSSISTVTIPTSGIITGAEVTAQSGSAHDIQAAVNAVAAAGGGTVRIPAGNFTFNIVQDGFNAINTVRTGVQVPGGVNIIGAGNNQTILYVPITAWDSTNHGTYVKNHMFVLNGQNNKPIRISGIYFQGSVNYTGGPTTDTYAKLSAICEYGVKDFRVDHNTFIDFSDVAILASNNYVKNPEGNCGVIDHCIIDNPYKGVYLEKTGGAPLWAYGIIVGGNDNFPTFNPDYTQFFGKYRHDIVYIEDCSISRTRHAVAGGSQSNAFYVLRYCTLTDMIIAGYGSYQDVHGGGEGAECYGNTIINTARDYRSNPNSIYWGQYVGIGFYSRGGFALYYDNTIKDFQEGSAITLANDQSVYVDYRTRNVWIWDNNYVNCGTTVGLAPNSFPIRENIEYFLRSPNQAQDGFTYTPYQYPFPLTSEGMLNPI